MKSAGKARSNGLYRHIRTSKEIIRNLLNDYWNISVWIYSNIAEIFITGNTYGAIFALAVIIETSVRK